MPVGVGLSRKIAGAILVALLTAFVIWEALPSSRQLRAASQLPDGRMEVVGYHKNLYAAHVTPDGLIYGIEDHVIYLSEDDGLSFHQVGILPKIRPSWATSLKDFVARLKSVRELRRNQGPSNLVSLSSGTILVFYDQIYRLTRDGEDFSEVTLHQASKAEQRDQWRPQVVGHGVDVRFERDYFLL